MAANSNRARTSSWPKSHLMNAASPEKLAGSFYTPPEIADFIIRWAFNGKPHVKVLEPGCGDGAFLAGIQRANCAYKSITGVELNPGEASKARALRLARSSVIEGDFHSFCLATPERFDIIVGNPPFIRYQFFDERQQSLAERIFGKAHLRYTRLANPWISFLVGSCLLLADTGKIGFVVPAELLQVAYARQVRQFLARVFNKITIVSFEKLLFDDVQQEVILLLCERDGSTFHRIDHHEVRDASALAQLDLARLRSPRKRLDFRSNKWTFYFLEPSQISFLETIFEKFRASTLGDFATVEVGITTGMNPFFTVNEDIVREYSLERFAHPAVGRSVQVSGARFTTTDWRRNVRDGARAYFLRFPSVSRLGHDPGVLRYLETGLSAGYHKGFKCRIRDEWQVVPSAWVPKALLLRRSHMYPRFVTNEAEAYTTDTMHRVTPRGTTDLRALVASFYNSMTFASSEVCGRSHGGGVLELMPNEAERLFLPYKKENGSLLTRIDAALREDAPIEEVLDFTDPIILESGLGLSAQEVEVARTVWLRLMRRRFARRHR